MSASGPWIGGKLPLATAEALANVSATPGGALIADVAHRTGTADSLLQLSGSLGQLTVANDVRAVGRHSGVAGEARMLGENPWIMLARWTHGDTWQSVSNTTISQPTALVSEYTAPGMVTNSNGLFNGSPAPFALRRLRFRGAVRFQDSAVTAGRRRVMLRMSAAIIATGMWPTGTPWMYDNVPPSNVEVASPPDTVALFDAEINLPSTFATRSLASCDLLMWQNSGAAMNARVMYYEVLAEAKP